jgi:DnaA family protein
MQQIPLDIGLERTPELTHYLPGPNEAALAQVQAWLAHQGDDPVPLYLWGQASSGKTYLLRAAQHALGARGLSSAWLDASTTYAPDFDENWGAIFCDEVQHYDAAQQQLAFSWLAQARALHIPVLCAGDAAPAALDLREDLRNRLGWGLVQQVQPLSEAQTRAVLRQEADARGIVLSEEVLDFMLRHFSRDLASLMELLEHIDGYALYAKRAVTVPLIKTMLLA